jgi:tetratricopeptide (TPR) repeat protein
MKSIATAVRGCIAVAAVLSIVLPPPAHGGGEADELAVQGFEHLSGGRFAEAAAALEKALAADPSSEPVRAALARAQAGLAAGHFQAGKLAEARGVLEKAAALQPEVAEYRLLLARVLFRQNDVREARREIDEALDLAPGSAPARELSGDLYDREGLLNRAVGEWEEAAVAGGSHALAGKIERGRREMAAEEGMVRESSRFFVVLYDRDVPQPLVKDLFGILDQAFNTLHDRLGEYPRDEIKVILYSRVAFRDITQMPDWAGGAYDGKIRIPVGGLTTVQEASGLLDILVHEMTHAFLHRMAPQGLPLWFNEGVATAFQGWDPEQIRTWFAEHPPEGLASLAGVERALRGGGGSVHAAYAAARLAIAELEEMRGFGAVRGVIAGVGEGRPFAEVFLDEMRVEVAEFEERWARTLR